MSAMIARCGRGADRAAVGVQLGDHGVVGICPAGSIPGRRVPRHLAQRRRDPLVVQRVGWRAAG